MMTDIYSRLKRLIEGIGFSLNDGGISKAEIMAYALGLELVKGYFDSMLNGIFLKNEEDSYVQRYCKMLTLNPGKYEADELKKHIIERLGERFSFFTADEFEKAFRSLGAGSYYVRNGEIVFMNMNIEAISRVNNFIEGYVPFCVTIQYSNRGQKFDQWDALGKTWDFYDSLQLRFDIIDSVGGEEFE